MCDDSYDSTSWVCLAASQAEQARPHGWLPPIGSCSQCSTGCGTRIEAGSSCQYRTYHTYQSFFIDLAFFTRIQNALVKDAELSLPGFYRVCMGMATIIQSPWTTVKEDLLWSKTIQDYCSYLCSIFVHDVHIDKSFPLISLITKCWWSWSNTYQSILPSLRPNFTELRSSSRCSVQRARSQSAILGHGKCI